MSEIKEITSSGGDAPSKSQRRRDALEIRSLAARLIGLSPALLARIPLDDDLRAAVGQARGIRSNVARKRQLQFVAKLLRHRDPEPIREALAGLEAGARELTARQHRVETWRDRLLEQGDPALGELLELRDDVDRQAARQLMRQAAKEAAAGKPPAAARSLFRMLRQLDERESLPT